MVRKNLLKELESLETDDLIAVDEVVVKKLAGEKDEVDRHEFEMIGDNPEEVDEFLKNWGKFSGISGGLKAIDDLTFGFTPGELIIIGGTPGVGKSAFVFGLAARIALMNTMVAIISLELTRQQLKGRIAKAHGKNWDTLPIIYQKVQHITRRELTKLTQKAVEGGASVMIVDYLQMLNTGTLDERAEISRIVKELKLLALEHNIVMIAISSLNRDIDPDTGLQMRNLSGSGAIEYYADMVLFLEKDEEHVRLKIAKNRSNPIDFKANTRHMVFDGATFKDVDNAMIIPEFN